MKKLYFILLFLLHTTTGFVQPQPPDTLWTKAFGGSSDDYGESVQLTSDGGYIICGTTYSYGAGDADVYLIKTDGEGNQQWYQTYGGSAEDVGHNVKPTSDGGYIITGTTWSWGAGDDDAILIKTDEEGNLQWQRTFGGYNTDCGWDVLQTSDGGYIIAGGTRSFGAGYDDVYLIKTDGDGNRQWYQTFGAVGGDWSYSIQLIPNNGYIIAGYSFSFGAGSQDVYLIKTDEDGHQLWYRIFGGGGSDVGRCAQQTDDEGYIIAGWSNSFVTTGWNDVYLVKTDENGNQQWYKTFGGNGYDQAYSILQTADDGYIIAGWTESFGSGDRDVYLIKTDSQGNQQWMKNIGGTDWEEGYCIQPASDGGYVVAGYTYSYGAGGKDVYLIRLASDSTSASIEQFNNEMPYNMNLYPVYPNPFNASTIISFKLRDASWVKLAIYDIQGEEVARLVDGWMEAGNHNAVFYGTVLPSGIYFARLSAGNCRQMQKMVLMK